MSEVEFLVDNNYFVVEPHECCQFPLLADEFCGKKITKIIGESFTVIMRWQWTFLLLIAQQGDNLKQFTGIPSTLIDLFSVVKMFTVVQ